MPDSLAPRQNQLLAALSEAECERLSPHLELVRMQPGEIIQESGCLSHHVYFPITAIVSLLYVMADGASAEIAGIGNEGMLGVPSFSGGETMPHRAMVLCAGFAYRLKSKLLRDEFNRAGALQQRSLEWAAPVIYGGQKLGSVCDSVQTLALG